jgi:hypothetical protein
MIMITVFRAIAFALREGFAPRGYAFASGIEPLPGSPAALCPIAAAAKSI